MLITKEQQEQMIENYVKEGHSDDECIGFIDGLLAILNLMVKIDKQRLEDLKLINESK